MKRLFWEIVENKLDTTDFALYNEANEYSIVCIKDEDVAIFSPRKDTDQKLQEEKKLLIRR